MVDERRRRAIRRFGASRPCQAGSLPSQGLCRRALDALRARLTGRTANAINANAGRKNSRCALASALPHPALRATARIEYATFTLPSEDWRANPLHRASPGLSSPALLRGEESRGAVILPVSEAERGEGEPSEGRGGACPKERIDSMKTWRCVNRVGIEVAVRLIRRFARNPGSSSGAGSYPGGRRESP